MESLNKVKVEVRLPLYLLIPLVAVGAFTFIRYRILSETEGYEPWIVIPILIVFFFLKRAFSTCTIGTDGLLVSCVGKRTYIAYRDILGVEHTPTFYQSSLHLKLRSGKSEWLFSQDSSIPIRWMPSGPKAHGALAYLAAEISDRAASAQAETAHSAISALANGSSAHEIQQLAVGDGYRVPAAENEALWGAARDVAAQPRLRVAALVALAAREPANTKRIASELATDTVSPATKSALNRIATYESDRDLDEALKTSLRAA